MARGYADALAARVDDGAGDAPSRGEFECEFAGPPGDVHDAGAGAKSVAAKLAHEERGEGGGAVVVLALAPVGAGVGAGGRARRWRVGGDGVRPGRSVGGGYRAPGAPVGGGASPGANGQGVEARRAGTVRVVERLGDALDDLHLGPRRRRRWIVGVARETKRRAQLRQGLHPPPVFRREDHVHDGSRVVGTVVGGERTRREVLREGGAVRHDAARARHPPEKRGRRLPEPRARQGVCRKTRTTRVVRRGTRLHHI